MDKNLAIYLMSNKIDKHFFIFIIEILIIQKISQILQNYFSIPIAQ